jgi:para-aminobenzoate synthetase/4-amino-4-deoxychorismate lyase
MQPTVILDDASLGAARLMRFHGFRAAIVARTPAEVPAGLAAIEDARSEGGHVAGYFSYELGYALEPKLGPLMPQVRRVPLFWFGVFDAAEHLEGPDASDFLSQCASGRAYAGPLSHEWDGAAYRERFETVQSLIRAGDIYQANLTFRSRFAFAGDPLALYGALRARSHASCGAFIDDGARQILSLSPELFFEISRDGRIVSKPMKGTAARGSDLAADAKARAALLASDKDRAENLMIVDLIRNDLGRIAETGSVDVGKLFAVETYPTLHQLVSTVSARLKPGAKVEDIVRALFPCGSVTGAPKIRAMEVIRALEQSPRELYCGAIGHFAPDGAARFNVAIRTITLVDGRGELGVGGGVVHDSTCDGEFEECLLKAAYFERERKPVELIETMRFAPGSGVARRALHMARLERSAAAFGIPFDVWETSGALERAVSHVTTDLRVRIALSESGEPQVTTVVLQPEPERSWRFAVSAHRVVSSDRLARHKTSWRELLDSEQAHFAQTLGCDEVVFLNEHDEVVEGSRTNVFLRRGDVLITPPLSSGCLDGCLRRELLESGQAIEASISGSALDGEAPIFLGNSLRGLFPAARVRQDARGVHRSEPNAPPVAARA